VNGIGVGGSRMKIEHKYIKLRIKVYLRGRVKDTGS